MLSFKRIANFSILSFVILFIILLFRLEYNSNDLVDNSSLKSRSFRRGVFKKFNNIHQPESEFVSEIVEEENIAFGLIPKDDLEHINEKDESYFETIENWFENLLPINFNQDVPSPQNFLNNETLNQNLSPIKEESYKKNEIINQSRIGAQMDNLGELYCNNGKTISEVIYWKKLPGDFLFESPITPHHGIHHDRYLTFEYDHGGWNNMRMGVECLIVLAHALGRTLVVPPKQHLYLLGKSHKKKGDEKVYDEMGFEDFYSLDLLQSQKGLHILQMQDFLVKEGVTLGLHGTPPPGNNTDLWGQQLWKYLESVADFKPEWEGKFFALPSQENRDFSMNQSLWDQNTTQRYSKIGMGRTPVVYDEKLRDAHHVHVPGHNRHRLLTHFYTFVFFEDPKMQTFYKRFIRDFLRYRDEIQCAGHDLLRAVRADARLIDPSHSGEFYALHIRRGDFQFKEVKIEAKKIVQNLKVNDIPLIPPGSLVYISTDDPNGVCVNCLKDRKPCESYPFPKPIGCPEDPSWNAFIEAGWHLRFLQNYTSRGVLSSDLNPNTYGMVESIVCSRAKLFAGTYFSTFTGYIHRLRGYHGMGEDSYYHSTNRLMSMKSQESVGHAWSREYRGGWTDDETGHLI